MQIRNRTGFRTLGGILLATSAWIVLAAAAQAQPQPQSSSIIPTTDSGRLDSIGTSTANAAASLSNIDISMNKLDKLESIDNHLFSVNTTTGYVHTDTTAIKGHTLAIMEAIGNVGDVQTITPGDDPCIPSDVVYSDATNTVINLLSQIVNILKGPNIPANCTSNSAALSDAMGMSALARKNALARGNSSSFKRWTKACEFGLNPTKYSVKAGTDDPNFDQEAKGNKFVAADQSKPCSQKDGYIRWDRSLETLIGPLEYRAPKTMTPPPSDGAFYDRFAGVGAGELNDDTYPMVAAAMFCMNVGEYFFPQLPVIDNSGSLENVRTHEAWESKTMANCWRMFEERVAYPKDMSGDFAKRHDQQVARCQADYKANLISLEAKTNCENNGRSTLKARADTAYRSDSQTYTSFLTKGLKYETQMQILGLAAGDIERFEQSLVLERQIMTDTLATARMAPLSNTTPMPGASEKAMMEILKALR